MPAPVLSQVEATIRRIDPGMNDRPVYLLDEREYRPPADQGLDCLGWTAALLDLQMAPQLAERGQWAGRGFATLLRLDRMPLALRYVGAVVAHEISHWWNFSAELREAIPPADELPSASDAATQLFHHAEAARIQTLSRRPPWDGHGAEFLRASAHYAYRFCRACDGARPWDLSFSMRYYSVCESVWMRLLDGELRHMESEPVRDILRTPAPRDFLEMHRLLTESWQCES